MSWDVVLLKDRFDLNDKDAMPPPLGERGQIIANLMHLFPSLNLAEKGYDYLRQNGYSIEINVGMEPEVLAIMLHIRGEGDPIEVLMTIQEQLKWQIMDGATGKFVEDSAELVASWQAFQGYRDQVIPREDD